LSADRDSFAGVLIGTAVGDALGLPREGLSARRAQRMFGPRPFRLRLLFGRGMVSDDTEHACMVAKALIRSRGDVNRFARSLAWQVRWWLLALPAGVGLATLRAGLKLWIGFSPHRSGVRSAGNGPAMRAAVIGVWAGNRHALLVDLIRVSTQLTHTDPRAHAGALAVALAASYGADRGPQRVNPTEYLDLLQQYIREQSTLDLLRKVVADVTSGVSLQSTAEAIGVRDGVSGFINQTVPLAIAVWLRWPGSYVEAVERIIELGGDTDTTGAIVGALVGATAGASAIPSEWIDGIIEYPHSIHWMRDLAQHLSKSAAGDGEVEKWSPNPLVLVRNVVFLCVVLTHGFRRLLPPY